MTPRLLPADNDNKVGGEAGYLATTASVVAERHRRKVRHPPDAVANIQAAGEVDQPFLFWLGGVVQEHEVLEVGRWFVDGEVEAQGHRWHCFSCCNDEVRSDKDQEEEAVASAEEFRHGYG